MSCVDSEGMRRDFEKGLTVKEIAEKYIVTEDMVNHVIGKVVKRTEGKLYERIIDGIIEEAHRKGRVGTFTGTRIMYVLDAAAKEWQQIVETYKKYTGPEPDITLLNDLFAWKEKWFGK